MKMTSKTKPKNSTINIQMQRETHKHTQTQTLEHTDIPEESKLRNHNIYAKCLYDRGKI